MILRLCTPIVPPMWKRLDINRMYPVQGHPLALALTADGWRAEYYQGEDREKNHHVPLSLPEDFPEWCAASGFDATVRYPKRRLLLDALTLAIEEFPPRWQQTDSIIPVPVTLCRITDKVERRWAVQGHPLCIYELDGCWHTKPWTIRDPSIAPAHDFPEDAEGSVGQWLHANPIDLDWYPHRALSQAKAALGRALTILPPPWSGEPYDVYDWDVVQSKRAAVSL